MKEFKVNDYITLKLVNDETVIFIKGESFKQCKFLLLNIPVEKVSSFDEIESVDEAAERLGWTEEGQIRTRYTYSISPETEFWAHCSNIQVWVENNYNTQLLHSNLAFPLLKKLVEVGDPIASRIFKDEIAKRFESNQLSVVLYLLEEKYFEYLNKEEFDSIIKNSEIIEILFKKPDIDYDDLDFYFKVFQEKAPLGLKYKIFNENDKLNEFIGDLLEEFPFTRYSILGILYNLYKDDKILRGALIKGIADIFQKGSFSLISDILNLLEEEGFEYLEDILENTWNSQFFTRKTPVIHYILNCLKGNDIYAKRRCISVLNKIWRYMEYGLSEEIIECILEDEENKLELLLRMVKIWYDGTKVLNEEVINKVKKLGDHAIEKLKNILKGKKTRIGFHISGGLDDLSFRSDLQEYGSDFNYTIEFIYNSYGANELIRYLDSFDDISYLIHIDKDNYPGPLEILASAFLECSESKDDFFIIKARNIYHQLQDFLQDKIIVLLTDDIPLFEIKEIIEYCLENNDFMMVRFFLNFDILSNLSKEALNSLLENPNFNFLEKLNESLKEINYSPLEIFNEFIGMIVKIAPEAFKKCIRRLDHAGQQEFFDYLNETFGIE